MPRPTAQLFIMVLGCLVALDAASAQSIRLEGKDAYGSWRLDKPGTIRLIRPQDLPAPLATPSAVNVSHIVARPAAAVPLVPPGFKVELFAEGFSEPRVLRVAPNGDLFVAETGAGRIRVVRAADGASKPFATEIFASGLNRPFGMAFFPAGAGPQWVYVADTDRVVRFFYHAGDMKASGPAEVVVAKLPTGGGHTTRDIVFMPDNAHMLVSVGSSGNVGEGMGRPPGRLKARGARQPPGAAWGDETDRAAVLAFDPDGKNQRLFATGIRNCVGLALQANGTPWCSTNERDGLGDDLVPDYVTRIRENAFYGWPWYYIGDHEDPRRAGERPDLKDKVTIPDVLLQAHSASLGMTFYQGDNFPSEYRGDGFAALHGSWNRSKRTGYKVVRIRMKDGVPTGEYEDFVVGFVVNDDQVWGRPVGVAVAHDGALLISEDGNGTIWRVSH